MQIDVERAGCLDGACLAYSMWDGYLADEKTKLFLRWLKGREIPMYKCHTSGHASVRSLQRLRTAFAGAVVCPVHTIDPMAFPQLFENVRVLIDGEHFDINRS
ncbi:MAG: MBL fold metallo-hydrolase, partial [Gammaproteobacteria bacterium]